MTADALSVVIPTYNQLPLLRATLTSLADQQSASGGFEVMVVDDGSTDGTGDFLRSYAGSLDMKPVIFDGNRGRSAARNAGAAAAARDLLLFVDGDMDFAPGFVSGHAAAHDGGDIAVIGRVVYDKSFGRSGYARYLEKRGAFRLKAGESVPGRYFLSGNASLPKRLFNRIGGFDESLRVYGEDLDFGVRLVEAGGRLIYGHHLVEKHLHLRSLPAALKLAYDYGREGLPRLVNRHPELAGELKLDRLTRTAYRALLSAPVYLPIKMLTSILSILAAPALFYSYLLYRNYCYGYYHGRQGAGRVHPAALEEAP